MDSSESTRQDFENFVRGFFPGASIRRGWDGLIPAPGQCFHEIWVPKKGFLMKVYGDSLRESLLKLIEKFNQTHVPQSVPQSVPKETSSASPEGTSAGTSPQPKEENDAT